MHSFFPLLFFLDPLFLSILPPPTSASCPAPKVSRADNFTGTLPYLGAHVIIHACTCIYINEAWVLFIHTSEINMLHMLFHMMHFFFPDTLRNLFLSSDMAPIY